MSVSDHTAFRANTSPILLVIPTPNAAEESSSQQLLAPPEHQRPADTCKCSACFAYHIRIVADSSAAFGVGMTKRWGRACSPPLIFKPLQRFFRRGEFRPEFSQLRDRALTFRRIKGLNGIFDDGDVSAALQQSFRC
jgi:hypothetical protein